MEEPKWKRALEDLGPPTKKQEDVGPPTKKQRRCSKDAHEILARLEEGLAYVENAPGCSKEAKTLAKELHKVLFNGSGGYLSPPPTLDSIILAKDQTEQTQTVHEVDHTDVPPPFPFDHTAVPPPFVGHSPIHPHPSISVGAPNLHTQLVPPASCILPTLPPITDLTLLSAPFTHTSTLPHYLVPTGTNTYEPLEFLGDAYLELMATRLIHDRFPNHTVGQKSGLREILIRNDTLSQYSREYGFGEKIKAAGLDRDHGGKAWTKVLADVFEAYVACVILSHEDRGMKVAEDWLTELWEPKVKEWREHGHGKNTAEQEHHASTDVKSMLQRWLVSKGVKLEYLEERPMEHIKDGNKTTFWMGVYLTGWGYNKARLGGGSGRSKQIAGAEAAKDAFQSGRYIIDDAHAKKLEHDKMKLMMATNVKRFI
jgi:dsRNA-specific ribonuclease